MKIVTIVVYITRQKFHLGHASLEYKMHTIIKLEFYTRLNKSLQI